MNTRLTHLQHATRIAQRFGLGRALTFWRAALREQHMMREWIDFAAAYVPENARDSMVMRPLRPYMRQHFGVAQRRDLLREHYRSMAQYFIDDPRLLRDEPGMVVATLIGKNEARYTMYIGGNTSKEGEMTFGLYDASGHYLAKLEATIGHDETGARVLWIGGLQGAKPPMGRDDVVRATKDLFGLRPKGAVLLAAQYFAQAIGLSAIRAPGNEGHISQRGFRRMRKKRMIHADYGQFWEEIGAAKIADEEYAIPVIAQVRDVNDVKPHKRSEWKKRQAISEQLAVDLAAALAGVRRI